MDNETRQDKPELNEREQLIVDHAINYAENFKDAGVPGHNLFMLIAKLASYYEEN